MRILPALLLFTIFSASCHKETDTPRPSVDPPYTRPAILLKDIIIPHLPSPYYHFEYNADSLPTKVDFSSDFGLYTIVYSGKRITEMRDESIINHDTLRYVYDETGRVVQIIFINEASVLYRQVKFTYTNGQLTTIHWDNQEVDKGFVEDRKVTLQFASTGDLKSFTDYRAASDNSPAHHYETVFEQYDDQLNVEDFSLLHDGIHDHLFLLPGIYLQRHNSMKETFNVDGNPLYTVDYVYTYNADHTPSTQTGNLVYLSGPDKGKIFAISKSYTYY